MLFASSKPTDRRRVIYRAFLAFVAILAVALVLIGGAIVLQGTSIELLSSPAAWLRRVDSSIAFDAVANAAELLAAILAIAITVVAIVVELAANRYSHRITSLFVREPVNIVVMGFFVVATIQSIWISLTLGEAAEDAIVPNAGFMSSIVMVTVALIILLPYFAYVLSYLSPVNVIDKIRRSAIASLTVRDSATIHASKKRFQQRIDELQDIARRAAEQSDRAVAMASINALCEVLLTYLKRVSGMPEPWFRVTEEVAGDPDFVSLSNISLGEIEMAKTWVEVKVMRQYLNFVISTGASTRDTTYVIAINTKHLGVAAIGSRPELVDLCVRCFNSYLRATINNQDQRTSYYIMNQYRELAEELLRSGDEHTVRTIALHFQFYGLLGFRMKMPFLLEVAAYDIVHLIEACIRIDSSLVDDLLDLILELDQDIREEFHEESLLGVRRAQIQLAAQFLEIADEDRAERICRDLKSELPERLARVQTLLRNENRRQYWEFTDRGVNFSYLEPRLRRHLDTIFARLEELPGPDATT